MIEADQGQRGELWTFQSSSWLHLRSSWHMAWWWGCWWHLMMMLVMKRLKVRPRCRGVSKEWTEVSCVLEHLFHLQRVFCSSTRIFFVHHQAKVLVDLVKCINIFSCLGLYGIWLELAHWTGVPLLIVLMEVEGGVPEGRVHVDVLLHCLEDRVGGGVPVKVPEVKGTR